jgi:hypothetical protein
LITYLQLCHLDLLSAFPHQSACRDRLSTVLLSLPLELFTDLLRGTPLSDPVSFKQLLFEFDIYCELLTSSFEYSSLADSLSTAFHSHLYSLLKRAQPPPSGKLTSHEVIREEDEDAEMPSVANSQATPAKETDDEDAVLTQQERELKRKGTRDLIFKAEYNFGGVLNCNRSN